MTKPNVSVQRLREIYDYNESTGTFTIRIQRMGSRPVGSAVGTPSGRGYLSVCIDKKNYLVHRLVWLYVYGVWPSGDVDHINGVKSDNRVDNLRDCGGTAINQENRRAANAGSESGILGVRKVGNTWWATIMSNKKKYSLGSYYSEKEAQAAYLGAKRVLHSGSTI